MKKHVLFTFFASLILILGGCGSNDKTDSISDAVNKYITLDTAMTSSGRDFNISMKVTKKLPSDYKIELNNFELISVGGCEVSSVNYPDPLVMTGGTGSTADVRFSGTFVNNCTPADYKIEFQQITTRDDRSKVETVIYDSSAPSTVTGVTGTEPVDSGFFNATTPMQITEASHEYEIRVQIVENGYLVSGKEVQVKPFVSAYGTISNPIAITGGDGYYAVFNYKSPQTLPVNGTSATIQLTHDNNGTVITQDIVLEFSISGQVDDNNEVPLAVIANSYKEISLTQNSQNAQIEVQVFERGTNIPYIDGNVRVSLPDNVLLGVDVGSFTEYSVAVGSNGKAVFNYTGPQDLQALIDSNETSAIFKFFHELNPTQTETATVLYDLQAGYIPANYLLTTSSADDKQTMNLDVLKTFTLYLKDDQGALIDDADINTITITSKNALVGMLVNSDTGAEETTLAFNGTDAVNSKSFSVKTNTLSGLLPIEVKVDFTDANGDVVSRVIIMNIVVLSGPPTAMSISYAGVEHDDTVAKYTEKFVVTVTDAYNNRVNTKPFIATGAIVEYAVDGSSAVGTRTTTSPRLWHGTNDPRGEIEAIGGDKAQFTTTSDVFNYVDISNDRLVVFGAGYVYEALGKWDLESIAPQLLELKDGYYGATRSDLGFAVGHNNRQDLCSGDQREYVGNMKSDTYQIDENGHVLIEFEYDYHLTGKDIMVWVNLTGFQADNSQTGRIGEAQKHTLRGAGFVSPELWAIEKLGAPRPLHFRVHHENAPEWYKNGHFGFSTKGNCTVHNVIDWSNSHDARVCSNIVGYVDLNVSNPTDKDCTISITNIAVSSEFNGVTYP